MDVTSALGTESYPSRNDHVREIVQAVVQNALDIGIVEAMPVTTVAAPRRSDPTTRHPASRFEPPTGLAYIVILGRNGPETEVGPWAPPYTRWRTPSGTR